MTRQQLIDDGYEPPVFDPTTDVRPSWAERATYPRSHNISVAFTRTKIVRPDEPEAPEYVTIPVNSIKDEVTVARWNMAWEAAQFTRRLFDIDALPHAMKRVAEQGDVNVVFVPRTNSRYDEYSLLFHLLPEETLLRFGLPLIQSGNWPHLVQDGNVEPHLTHDFADKLSNAWASHVWRDLMGTSPISGFRHDEPIRLLGHNLDYWLPHATQVAVDILGEAPYVNDDDTRRPAILEDGSPLVGATLGAPRMGVELWHGEHEAKQVMQDVLEVADQRGNLRSIVDAVRSNRVEEDFSTRWTHAREDFERKLYKKRSKVSVKFVELKDTIPVQGPESEVHGNIVTSDFLALLSPKNRQIVVLLNSGTTKLTDIGEVMGYANHSPVTKRLAEIRLQASAFFDQQG